jgi:transcriptional regulator with AAA-type ATPase domain
MRCGKAIDSSFQSMLRVACLDATAPCSAYRESPHARIGASAVSLCCFTPLAEQVPALFCRITPLEMELPTAGLTVLSDVFNLFAQQSAQFATAIEQCLAQVYLAAENHEPVLLIGPTGFKSFSNAAQRLKSMRLSHAARRVPES